MKAADRILFLLKTRGARSTQFFADDLQVTSMGARKQLQALEEKGLVEWDDRSEGIGRPTRYWQLTEAGHARFPDRHSELSLQIIGQVKTLFGMDGLQKLIDGREQQARSCYRQRLDCAPDLPAKIEALAAVRAEEGYMAEAALQPDGSWLLLENHCPICAAARECQQFCRSELALFQEVLGPQVQVTREEHILSGARRCAYRIVHQST